MSVDITPIRNFINTLQNNTSKEYCQLLKKEHIDTVIQCFSTLLMRFGLPDRRFSDLKRALEFAEKKEWGRLQAVKSSAHTEYVALEKMVKGPMISEKKTWQQDMATSLPCMDDLVCASCERGDSTTNATKWCKECSEGLCDNCSRYHTQVKQLSRHQLVTLADVPDAVKMAGKLHINIHCVKHPAEPIVVYCRSEERFGCTICAVTSHKHCTDVVSLDEVAASYTADVQNDDIAIFKKLQTNLKTMMNDEDTALTDINNKASDSLKQAAKTIQSAKKFLDQMYSAIETDMRAKQCKVRRSKEDTIGILKEFETKCSEVMERVTLLPNVTTTHGLIERKRLIDAIHSSHREMTKCLQKTDQINMDCITTDTVIPALQKLSPICKIIVESQDWKPTKDEKGMTTIISELEPVVMPPMSAQVQTIKRNLMESDIKHVNTIKRDDLKRSHKNTSDFSDGVFLRNNDILITDYANARLFRFDEEYSIKCELAVGVKPSSLCVSSNDETHVHVLCGKPRILETYSLHGKWRRTDRFDTEPEAWGLASNGESIITCHVKEINVYDINGRKLKTIGKRGDFTYQAVSPDGNRLYHMNGDVLVCRLMNTTHLDKVFTREISSLKNPRGMCTDASGNIYIVGYNSKNVVQVSPDGFNSRVLIDKFKSIQNPIGLFYNKNKDILVVTSDNEDTLMEVYEFD